MTTAGQILARVRETLFDPNGDLFSDATLYDMISRAMVAVVTVKNDAYRVIRDLPLVAGYVQRLPLVVGSGGEPERGLAVFEVLANVGGPAIQQVGRELLTAANPNWVNDTPQSYVDEWMGDLRDPSRYLVNPPNDGTGMVTVLYGAVPEPVVTSDEPIVLSPIYDDRLWEYALSLAYAADTKRKDLTKALQYRNLFNQALGLRTASQVQVAPKLDNQEPA